MAFLLDTCLLSEFMKPRPDAGVIEWLGGALDADLFISVLTLGELRKGIERLAAGKKRASLQGEYTLIRSRFSSRVLPIDSGVAERWGDLSAAALSAGRHLHPVDGLIAATALEARYILVTRNVADFDGTRVPIMNPWVG